MQAAHFSPNRFIENHVVLARCHLIEIAEPPGTTACATIEVLYLGQTEIDEETLQIFQQARNLYKLYLGKAKFTQKTFSNFRNSAEKIQCLDIRLSPQLDINACIDMFPNLKDLDISGCQYDEQILEKLNKRGGRVHTNRAEYSAD